MTDPRPANVPWLTPYLAVRNAQASIRFYGDAFGFETRELIDEDGAIMHVEMSYHGQLILMFAPEGAFGSTARTPRSAAPTAWRRNPSTCMSTTSMPRTSARSRPAASR